MSTGPAGGSREDRSHAGRIALRGLGVSAPRCRFQQLGHLHSIYEFFSAIFQDRTDAIELIAAHGLGRLERSPWTPAAAKIRHPFGIWHVSIPPRLSKVRRLIAFTPAGITEFTSNWHPEKIRGTARHFHIPPPSSGRHYYNATIFAERYSTFSL